VKVGLFEGYKRTQQPVFTCRVLMLCVRSRDVYKFQVLITYAHSMPVHVRGLCKTHAKPSCRVTRMISEKETSDKVLPLLTQNKLCGIIETLQSLLVGVRVCSLRSY